MFSAVAHKNLAGAEGYFVEHLSQNDYYTADEIHPGQWIGTGAERLSLGGQVTREQFYALCENQHPQTGDQLTLRQNAKDERRVFFDFTCSAPKSVSVLAVTMNDQRLVAAHEEAAKAAFRELETFAAARIRKNGSQRDRATGNLIAATFLHNSSRALDPQLHTHFTVFNATFDDKEQCWKALQAGAMYQAIRYATAVYRNELAKRIYEIGFHITPSKHGFEIKGVSDDVLKRFSQRSQQRDAVAREMEQKLGRKLSNNEVAYAVHRSRASKLKGISTAEVREHQLAQLSPDELQSLRRVSVSARIGRILSDSNNEPKMLAYAVAHIFERKSVAPEHELLAAALSYRHGEMDLPKLKTAMQQSPDLVRTQNGLSTRQILETELSLIETVNAGRDAVTPLNSDYQPADWLGDDQRLAILHILNTNDRITGLRGLAGTGKTTALRELVNACDAVRIESLFCAPTAAATDILRKEGFNGVTLQSLLASKQSLSNHNLIVLDEAGAVGIDDMKRLFDSAKDCRIVLSGDTGQHGSVARGDALRILEQHSSLASGQLTRIRRQRRAEYRKAVELAAQKRTIDSFVQLERMGVVKEFSDGKLYDSAAQAYVKALNQNQSALLVAPTWNEIEAVTEKVRDTLKSSGRLAGDEKEFQVFDLLSWTEAQKRDARQYRAGHILNFQRTVQGFTKGESAEIVGITDGVLQLRKKDGAETLLKLGAGSACFDVGEERKLKVAAGDKLLLQANWRKKFINGELVEVKAVQGDSILLADGRVIPENYRTFTHGYAVTSHAAQGKTVDEVLVVASARSLPAINQQQFYVSISRGRERCRIFTDDVDQLRMRVTDSSERPAAVEMIPHSDFIQNILRRGNHFLKRFRQRIAQSLSLQNTKQILKPSYEHQHQTRRGVRV